MAGDAAEDRATPRLLTLGRVDRLLVQVGYRTGPDEPAYEQFLLDLPVPDADRGPGPELPEQHELLAALEPVLYAGSEAPRHYSLHQHRWHTSWGASPGVLELGLFVTTGRRSPAAVAVAGAEAGVSRAFRHLMELVGRPEPAPASRAAAVARARRAAATAYGVEPESLTLSTEEHHPARSAWTVSLRAPGGGEYAVTVGLVDGYAGSVRVRHHERIEVFDSIGPE